MLRTPIIANINDDEAGRFAVTHTLRAAGYVVWEGGSAKEAHALALKNPDIILLDIMLPDGNGFEVCRELKATTKTSAITIVHMSAHRTAGTDRVDGLDGGADGYIIEPVSAEELLATLKVFIRMRHAETLQRALNEASGRMAELLDIQICVETLAEVVVPFFGDFCAVHMLEQASHPAITVRRHRDPQAQADWDAKAQDITAARSTNASDATWQLYRQESDALPPLLSGLTPCCWLQVPLRARSTTLGYVTLGLENKNYNYELADVEAIVDLMARAALSLNNAQLVKQAQRRSDFEQQLIAIVSHDLRGPLQVIQLSSELLLRSESITERELRPARRIANSVGRMHRMIGELLDFTQARLGAGIPIKRAPISVRTLVRQAVDDVEVAHPDRSFVTELNDAGIADVDAERFLQVLSNLLGNAVSHSPAGAPISVKLSGTPNNICVTVNNANIDAPMPAELLAVLFEPFKRGGVRMSTRDKSFGLGLYIVDQIVRGHGGSLKVVSDEPSGTTFAMTLPRYQ